jgi:hypothetical protein
MILENIERLIPCTSVNPPQQPLSLRLYPGNPRSSRVPGSFHSTRTIECVLGKCPRQSPLAAHFLASNKGLNGHSNGSIDILRAAVLGEAHFGESFGDTHDGLEVADL